MCLCLAFDTSHGECCCLSTSDKSSILLVRLGLDGRRRSWPHVKSVAAFCHLMQRNFLGLVTLLIKQRCRYHKTIPRPFLSHCCARLCWGLGQGQYLRPVTFPGRSVVTLFRLPSFAFSASRFRLLKNSFTDSDVLESLRVLQVRRSSN